jgi:LPXTG-motif cell wall-anchored protein
MKFSQLQDVEKITISGEKIWEDDNNFAGERPSSITVELLQNGIPYRTQTVTADQNNQWLYTFTDLPKFDANGAEYVYAVNEAIVPTNYTVQVDGFNLINTYDGSNQSSSTTDSSDTTSTTDTTSSTDSTNSTGTSDSTSSTDSTDSTSTSDSTSSTDSTDSTSTSDTTSTTRATDTTGTSDTASTTGATDTTNTTESTSSTDEPIITNENNSSNKEQNILPSSSNTSHENETKEKYLLRTGSTVNKGLITIGIVLIASVLMAFVWKRRNEQQ